MSSVAAIVVTHNRKELLEQCIENLLAQNLSGAHDVSLEIVVVDNASTDGTEEALLSLVSARKVRYFNTGENLGGAGGFNYGMRVATEESYDYVWVMDDDCLVAPDTLRALLDAAATIEGPWGYLSSVARWTDGSICAMNVQRHPLFSNITDFEKAIQPCTLASFVSLLVPMHVVAQVGLPIAEFFIWTDDWEFTRRISRMLPCYVVGTSKVVHASASNEPGTIYTDTPDRLDRYRYVYRNDVVLYRQEGVRGRAYLVLRALYHMVRVVFGPIGQKRERLHIIAKGNIDGAHFHPGIEYVGDTRH